MQLTFQTFRNVWFANGAEISNIVIYDHANGVLVDTQRTWLEIGGRAIQSLPQIAEIVARNKVNLTREEHFVCKGVLYINAALFDGYSTVNIEHSTSSEGTQSCNRKYIEIKWQINDHDSAWYRITEARYDNYELTDRGAKAQAVLELFNKKVTYSRSSDISLSQAARLMDIMPQLAEIVGKAN